MFQSRGPALPETSRLGGGSHTVEAGLQALFPRVQPGSPQSQWTADFPHFPLTRLGAGEGLLSPAVGVQVALGRGGDAPGWLGLGCMHSSLLDHLLGVCHVQGTARSPASSGQLGTAFP